MVHIKTKDEETVVDADSNGAVICVLTDDGMSSTSISFVDGSVLDAARLLLSVDTAKEELLEASPELRFGYPLIKMEALRQQREAGG